MKNIVSLILLFLSASLSGQNQLDQLLKNYVDANGNVNYQKLSENKVELNAVIQHYEISTPQDDWSDNKEKAFWINVYNAYTLQIIIDHYPLKSITYISKKGKTAWKHPFVKVGGKTYTLDQVEHEILRKKFKDPRIHVGVNCASISCPKLANFAFTEENIENSLEKLMKDFINDSNRNQLSKKKIQISEIFNWFKDDFTQEGSLIAYLNKYSKVPVDKKAKIKFLTYNWNLNGK